jgi:hypothetical protein
MPKSQSRKKKSPKRVLALPDLEQAKTAVLNSLKSASSQHPCEHAIAVFELAGSRPTPADVGDKPSAAFRPNLPPGRLQGAVRSRAADSARTVSTWGRRSFQRAHRVERKGPQSSPAPPT